jgi:hypothetical protein
MDVYSELEGVLFRPFETTAVDVKFCLDAVDQDPDLKGAHYVNAPRDLARGKTDLANGADEKLPAAWKRQPSAA